MYSWSGGLGMVLCGCLLGTVFSESNKSPQITISPTDIIAIMENKEIGGVIGKLNVKDADGDDITFQITDDFTKEHVRLGMQIGTSSVDGISVDVILIKQLDRETDGSSVTLIFRFSDGKDEFYETRMIVLIKDINDEFPKFDNLTKYVEIHENADIGHTVTKMTAVDMDLGDVVSYTMEASDVNYKSDFGINSTSGEITLKTPLDFEMYEYYKFTVHAEDSQQHKSENAAVLIIKVLDVQDTPPAFLQQSYHAQISEDVPVNDPVIEVTAVDGDRSYNNGITYKFVEEYYHFDIEKNTGKISVASSLDTDEGLIHEKKGLYMLHVEAMEEVVGTDIHHGDKTSKTVVIVEISDVNDNSPEFESDQYEARVKENTPAGEPVVLTGDHTMMVVKDLDQGVNSHIKLTIEKGSAIYDDFLVVPSEFYSTVVIQIFVNNSDALDYETAKTITFQVVATEINTQEKHSRSTTVTLYIDKTDDLRYPQFKESSYVNDVEENSPVDTPVTLVEATSTSGDVEYSLHGDKERFTIDSQSGKVTVLGELDKETKDKYHMFVRAKDSNGLKTDVELIVRVIDVNDNPPVFKATHYYRAIEDGAEKFIRPVIVKAVDIDQPGTKNSEVRYFIESTPPGIQDVFVMDSETGEITLTGPIKLDELDSALERTILLNITAHDLGQLQQSSSVVVTIDVIAISSPTTGALLTSEEDQLQMILIATTGVLVLICLILGVGLCMMTKRYNLTLKTYGALPPVSGDHPNTGISAMPTTNKYASGNSNPLYSQPQPSHAHQHRNHPKSLHQSALAGDRLHRF